MRLPTAFLGAAIMAAGSAAGYAQPYDGGGAPSPSQIRKPIEIRRRPR